MDLLLLLLLLLLKPDRRLEAVPCLLLKCLRMANSLLMIPNREVMLLLQVRLLIILSTLRVSIMTTLHKKRLRITWRKRPKTARISLLTMVSNGGLWVVLQHLFTSLIRLLECDPIQPVLLVLLMLSWYRELKVHGLFLRGHVHVQRVCLSLQVSAVGHVQLRCLPHRLVPTHVLIP